MKIVDAFATPLAKVSFPNADIVNEPLYELICEMSQAEGSDDEGRAHVGGWYSRRGFLQSENPSVQLLREYIAGSLKQYLSKAVSPEFASRSQLTMSAWVALTGEGDYQTPHIHPGTHLSAVYYAHVPNRPEPEGMLTFITPVGEQELDFFSSVAPSGYTVQPRAGDLVIFPSYLRHYTHPFKGVDRRAVVVVTANVLTL